MWPFVTHPRCLQLLRVSNLDFLSCHIVKKPLIVLMNRLFQGLDPVEVNVPCSGRVTDLADLMNFYLLIWLVIFS